MQTNAEIVLATFRAVEERDPERLFALCSDDVEFHDATSLPYGGAVRGKATLRERLETAPETTWLGTWGALQPTEAERRMDPRVVACEGDVVWVVFTPRAVGADGERFGSPVLALYEVRDGKLARGADPPDAAAAILAFLERAAGSRGPLAA